MLRLYNYKILSTQLLNLFQYNATNFFDIGEGGDLAKIGYEINYGNIIRVMKNIIILIKFSRKRNII